MVPKLSNTRMSGADPFLPAAKNRSANACAGNASMLRRQPRLPASRASAGGISVCGRVSGVWRAHFPDPNRGARLRLRRHDEQCRERRARERAKHAGLRRAVRRQRAAVGFQPERARDQRLSPPPPPQPEKPEQSAAHERSLKSSSKGPTISRLPRHRA